MAQLAIACDAPRHSRDTALSFFLPRFLACFVYFRVPLFPHLLLSDLKCACVIRFSLTLEVWGWVVKRRIFDPGFELSA